MTTLSEAAQQALEYGRKAYEHFILICKLTQEEKNANA